jgi:hypothetical protein
MSVNIRSGWNDVINLERVLSIGNSSQVPFNINLSPYPQNTNISNFFSRTLNANSIIQYGLNNNSIVGDLLIYFDFQNNINIPFVITRIILNQVNFTSNASTVVLSGNYSTSASNWKEILFPYDLMIFTSQSNDSIIQQVDNTYGIITSTPVYDGIANTTTFSVYTANQTHALSTGNPVIVNGGHDVLSVIGIENNFYSSSLYFNDGQPFVLNGFVNGQTLFDFRFNQTSIFKYQNGVGFNAFDNWNFNNGNFSNVGTISSGNISCGNINCTGLTVASGNLTSNNLTVNGVDIFTSNYKYFKGDINDYLSYTAENLNNKPNGYTISFWIRTSIAKGTVMVNSSSSSNIINPVNQDKVFGWGTTPTTYGDFGVYVKDTVNGVIPLFLNGANLRDNAWHNIVLFVNSTGAYLYYDNILGATSLLTNSTTCFYQNGFLLVGSGYYDAVNYPIITNDVSNPAYQNNSFAGIISNIQLYNTALTATDVTTIFNNGVNGAPPYACQSFITSTSVYG